MASSSERIPVKYLAKYNYATLAESCSPDFEFSYIDIGSVTYTDGITNYQNFKFKDAPSRARRIVHSGDILVSTVRTYLRAVACVNEHRLPQIASTGFLVLQADTSKIHPHFLMYSVLSDNFICKVEANSVGISYPAINASQIVHFKLPIPQLSEQFLLVTYLDRQCSEIDALLSKNLSSIEDYKKLKQAVITQAVTKGVRGEREMKDSGVEWIGEIPKEWGRTKIKMIASFFNGDRTSRYPQPTDFVDDGIAFLTSRNIDGDEVNLSETKYITESKYNSLSGAKIQIDDIIFCLRGSVGKCAINQTLSCGTVASSLATIRPKDIHPKYLLYSLLSNVASIQTTVFMNGTCAANLSAENVANYYITLPSSTEQKEIADYLDAKCAEIDGLIAKKEQLVKELESYKKSLIYEVVTGKREV